MKFAIVALVLLAVLFAVSFYVGQRSGGGSQADLSSLSSRSWAQGLSANFAPTVDLSAIGDPRVSAANKTIAVAGRTRATIAIPTSKDPYRRLTVLSASAPVTAVYTDNDSRVKAQDWNWRTAKKSLTVSGSGGTLSLACLSSPCVVKLG